MISPALFSIYQLSLSLFSCYETLQLKPRLPQFITGGTKAKALDKAGQTNSNQLPLNTHITPLSALLTYKRPIQCFSFCLFLSNFHNASRIVEGMRKNTERSQQVEDLLHLEISFYILHEISKKFWIYFRLVFLYNSKNNVLIFLWCNIQLQSYQCNITCLWLSTSSALPNHETSLFSPASQISIYGCSHAKKGGGAMRNGPPPSPHSLHSRQSPSEKCQRTGNQSL